MTSSTHDFYFRGILFHYFLLTYQADAPFSYTYFSIWCIKPVQVLSTSDVAGSTQKLSFGSSMTNFGRQIRNDQQLTNPVERT